MNDALPYDNLQELALTVQAVFSGNTLTTKQSNETLGKMAQDPIRFIDSMMKIITSEDSSVPSQRIKKAAAVILPRILSPHINKQNNMEKKAYILEATITGLFSPNLLPNIKASLQQFLTVIYHSDLSGQFARQSLILAKEKLAQGNLNDYASALYLVHSLLENPSTEPKAIVDWFLFLVDELKSSGDAMINGIGGEILGIMKGEHDEQKVMNLFTGIEVLRTWVLLIAQFIKKLGINNNRIDVFIDKEGIGKTLLKTMLLLIPTTNQVKECLFSTSGLSQLDILLNSVKAHALGCFKTILEMTLDASEVGVVDNPLLDPKTNKFSELIQTDGIKAILKSLFQLCKSDYSIIEKGLQDREFHQCLNECLHILIKLTSFPGVYDTISTYKGLIVMYICFPLIASTKEDLLLFRKDPALFVSLTTNLEEEEEEDVESAKIQSLRLLSKLCENIDGALSYLVLLVAMIIDYSLTSNNFEKIDEEYPKLKEYKESLFLKTIEPRIRVEACLVVLAKESQSIMGRNDLMVIIEKVFTKYHEYFLGAQLDPLIKSRMCLFLGSYVVALFRQEENKILYEKHLRFLIECAAHSEDEEQQSVIEQANQTLCEMLGDRAHLVRMAPFVTEILERLSHSIPSIKRISFFDVLYDILRIYSSIVAKTPELLLSITSNLVERAQKEYEHVSDRKQSKLILQKIWSLVRVIGERKDYLPLQSNIEKTLVPIFAHITGDDQITFDDEVLSYVKSTVSVSKHVSPLAWEIFDVLPKIFIRSNCLLKPLFPALNQIILHGRNKIEGNPHIINQLIEMGIQALNSPHPDNDRGSLSITALFFQIMITYIGIPNEAWEKMLTACCEKLKACDKSYLKARFGGVFLLAFLRNFELTEACLKEQIATEIIRDLFIGQAIVFGIHVYDRKVFLISLSHFLLKGGAYPYITEMLTKIFDVLVSFLAYIQYTEHKNALAKSKKKRNRRNQDEDEDDALTEKEILQNFLENKMNITSIINVSKHVREPENDDDDDNDEDSSDYEEEEAYFPTEKDEANHFVTHMTSDIKEQDEFVVFRDTVQKLKQENQELLNNIAMNLPENKQNLLKEVLRSQRVVLNQSEGQTQARKMVKPVGRKIADVKLQNKE